MLWCSFFALRVVWVSVYLRLPLHLQIRNQYEGGGHFYEVYVGVVFTTTVYRTSLVSSAT